MSQKNSYHHLKLEKRVKIQVLLAEGYSLTSIAERCNLSKSTVSRELKRQSTGKSTLAERRRLYTANDAQIRYAKARLASRPHGKLTVEVLRQVEKSLKAGWSPEEIANASFKGTISHVTIYRWLYKGIVLYGDIECLRHKGRRRYSRKNGGCRRYAVSRSIHSRPEQVNSREEFGHWEVDSVMSGRNGKGCVFTMVERKTRMLYAFVSKACTAANFVLATTRLLGKLPPGAVKSFTADRGSEFADYAEIEEKLNIPVYFADPHSPWQKGTNENTNGLLREYFPKKTDFSKVTQSCLMWQGVYRINNRPRKILGWETARKRFKDELNKLML